jgi:osmotically-inducible protein OsmY
MGKKLRQAVAGTLAVLGLGAPAAAAEPARPGPILGMFRDMRLGVHARRALHADPELKKLNLTVKVEDGAATLWGPVPSADLERRALALLEEVPGIQRVRSELYVVPGAGQPKKILFDLLPPPIVVQVASPDRDTGELKRDLMTPAETTSGRSQPNLPRLDGPRPIRDGPSAEGRAQARPEGRSLVEVIEELRRGNRRYDGIHLAVRGGVVCVWAEEVAEENVEAFARAVRAVPGVKEVKHGE